jgi:hypothetical protein
LALTASAYVLTIGCIYGAKVDMMYLIPCMLRSLGLVIIMDCQQAADRGKSLSVDPWRVLDAEHELQESLAQQKQRAGGRTKKKVGSDKRTVDAAMQQDLATHPNTSVGCKADLSSCDVEPSNSLAGLSIQGEDLLSSALVVKQSCEVGVLPAFLCTLSIVVSACCTSAAIHIVLPELATKGIWY